MAILNFQKPDKVIMIESTDFALRRVLLSSLEGYAISSLKMEGVNHEFSTIKGVKEDVTEIILNLKQVRFKKQIDAIKGRGFTEIYFRFPSVESRFGTL